MEFIYRNDEYIKKSKRAEGAKVHNSLYRSIALGAYNDTFSQAVKDGTFDNMYIADTFTMNGHTYHIAGFNTEWGTEKNTELGNHICLITDNFGDNGMNNSDTTQGGFAGSDMFKNTLPKLVSQLKADWGDHLLEFNEFLSTGIDLNGAPNIGAWFKVQACLMNTTQVFGAPTQYSNNANGEKYNIGNENSILPLFKLKPSDRNTGYWWWLRDIYNSQDFASVRFDGSAVCYNAYGGGGVRAFFLVR